MKTWIVLAVAMVAGVARGEDNKPLAPTKLIELAAVVDNIAGESDKVTVSVRARIQPTETAYSLTVSGGNDRLELSLADAETMGKALQAIAKDFKVGEAVKVGGWSLRVGQIDSGAKYVSISRTGSFSSTLFNVDVIAPIAESMLKAKGVAAWLTPRVAPLQKRE